MKVPFKWLRELVELNISDEELVNLLPLRTIGTKEVTKDFMELDMKGYNRADLLSMRGVAREVAAITESRVKSLESSAVIPAKSGVQLAITIEDESLCPLYCLIKIEGLRVADSPKEWKEKLEQSGMRPVNNITDITNLVMLEYGQPLHAFEATSVKDEKIVVRSAKTGEKLTTLDGKIRVLEGSDLLIADTEKPLGLAGVMGGKDSEVTDSTTSILLEAAVFDPVTLRKTSQRLGLYSEASKRFQHGLTKTNLIHALNAAIKMYETIGGKVVATSSIGDLEDKPLAIPLNLERIRKLIGVELMAEEMVGYLTQLGFEIDMKDGYEQNFTVTPPYWRLDIQIEEDVIEEIARLYGYEKIPAKELQGELPEKIDQSQFNLVNDLRAKFVKAGFTEVQTYSFYTINTLEALGWNNEKDLADLIKLKNPMSSETEYLRDMLWPNLAEVTDKNIRNGFSDVAVFEIGKVYKKQDAEIKEGNYLAATLVNGSDNPMLELVELTRKIFHSYPGFNLVVERFNPIDGVDFFHPNRTVIIYLNNKEVGGIAEIHQRTTDKLGLTKRLAALEINLDELGK